jgi:hypothetical protein
MDAPAAILWSWAAPAGPNGVANALAALRGGCFAMVVLGFALVLVVTLAQGWN